MDSKGDTRLVSMVNTRGRVMWVHSWEVENLRRQGCKVIYNPKAEYYPQYDLQNAESNKIIDDVPEALPNTVEQSDVLEVEEL